MTEFTKYRKSEIADRQLDTFLGLAKGMVADGVIVQLEAEYLQNWLIANSAIIRNPRLEGLWQRVTEMLEDGVLDEDEATELLATLRTWTGEAIESGELLRSASFPINQPPPLIEFTGKHFLFTGICSTGSRRACHAIVERLGGIADAGVTRRLDYLVIAEYCSDEWKHETYGRKIEKADTYRAKWGNPAIVTETHWRTFLAE